MRHLLFYTDASVKNGMIGLGVSVRERSGLEVGFASEALGTGVNYSAAHAEYEAVLLALSAAVKLRAQVVEIVTDCHKVAAGEYPVGGGPALKERVDRYVPRFDHVKFTLVPRSLNARAHHLARAAIGAEELQPFAPDRATFEPNRLVLRAPRKPMDRSGAQKVTRIPTLNPGDWVVLKSEGHQASCPPECLCGRVLEVKSLTVAKTAANQAHLVWKVHFVQGRHVDLPHVLRLATETEIAARKRVL